MNSILKAAIRASSLKYLPSVAYHARVPVNKVFDATKLQFTRTLWSMWSPRRDNEIGLKVHHSFACGCGCGIQRLHTKGEKELVEFLTEEIAAEKKLQKVKTIPTEVEDFKVELNGSEVTLTKKSGDEKITVFFNVNHTVDAESEPELNPNMDKPEFADMRSKPNFEVDIQRGNRTLGFTCSFNADQTPQEDDVFGIDEVTLYDGEWSEQTYAVAGDVLDGYLYDLLMNILEEKGISNEFVEKLSDLSTAYEHSCYLALLENLQKFASGK
ncbi:hypothetical protein R5R35_007147 [Gryllus longicercus]|uniref:Complement component 1 Q subcomponent-binding protein, mitochondrial n=1 Tax=Gryllus longicercus TaxID=2509291 RepID=A0AAN9V778_9ORTH